MPVRPKLRRRPPASAPKPKVRPNYEKKIAQELPRLERAAQNLWNCGVTKTEMRAVIDAIK